MLGRFLRRLISKKYMDLKHIKVFAAKLAASMFQAGRERQKDITSFQILLKSVITFESVVQHLMSLK